MGFDFAFDPASRRALGRRLIDRIDEYFSSLPERPVQLPLEQRSFRQLTDRMPELGEDAARVLDDLFTELVDKGFHVPSANYFGLMNPTPTYMAVLAEAMVAALNPQLASLARSQLASKIEMETVRWIAERVVNGSPVGGDIRPATEWGGTFTSGGNEANFSALALALAQHFPQYIEQGAAAIGAQPVLYASVESHHSLDKSAGLLGLGRRALRRITVNDRLQLDPALLEQAIERDRREGRRPFCVVATAGTTNSGAVDDLEALADIARRHRLWLHVDGAYGAALIFSNRDRHLVRGIARADSVTIDPHKWLAMPFAAGVVVTSHPELLEQAFGVATPYMPKVAEGAPAPTDDVPQPDNARVSTQWSRRMNSLKFWLTLRVHGRQAYEELIGRQLGLARSFYSWLEKSEEFEPAAPLVLPIVNFRLRGLPEAEAKAVHGAIVDEVTRDGRRWISTTTAGGRNVMRMMVISYLTEERHLRDLEQALVRAARALRVPTREK
jgi:glutamate/tyrosine decarboxylase-like PLP-dependent enzyme